MAGESVLSWMSPGPCPLPPKDIPTQPPHTGASQHPGYHARCLGCHACAHSQNLQALWPIPVALDTHHA